MSDILPAGGLRALPVISAWLLSLDQIHHAVCEMLADVLAPLIRSNQPHSCPGLSPGLLADWYNTVLRLKNEVGQWVNKHSKHTNVGGKDTCGCNQPCACVACGCGPWLCTLSMLVWCLFVAGVKICCHIMLCVLAGGLPAGDSAGVPGGRRQLREAGGKHGRLPGQADEGQGVQVDPSCWCCVVRPALSHGLSRMNCETKLSGSLELT